MSNAGTSHRPPSPNQENAMTPANFATRRLSVPAIVTAAVAAWFVLATGTALAEAPKPGVAAATPVEVTLTPLGAMKLVVEATRHATPAPVALTPDGAMKLTVLATRPSAPAHVTLTPAGSLKLTVVGSRTQAG
jgi:hypothetical protein